MDKEKVRKMMYKTLDKSKELSKSFFESFSETVSKLYKTRQTYKQIIDWSTQEDLYARGNEVNPPLLKFKSLKWVLVGFLFYLVANMFSKTLLVIGLALIFLAFWNTPRSIVKTHCNRILAASLDKIDDDVDRNAMLLSLVQLMKDLEAVGLSGRHTADSSGFKRIEFDKFGDITVIHFEQEGKIKNVKLTNWNQSEFQVCYVIPQIHDSLSDAHLVLHSKFTVSLSHYATQDWEGFANYILEDEKIARAFPQVRKKYEEQDEIKKQNEEIAEQAMKAVEMQEYLKGILEIIQEKKINKRVGFNIEEIMNKKDEWNMSVYDPKNHLSGNEKYAKMRLKLRNNAQYKDVKKLESTLERALNCDVTISPISSDKGSVMMLLLYETELKSFKANARDIVDKLNVKDYVVLGDSYTGGLMSKFNNQANHMLVTGQSGAGKSVLITNIMTQLTNLNEYKFSEVYVGSAAKVADFVAFEKQGAFLTEGTDNVIDMLDRVLEIARERERIFKEKGVKNLEEYNFQARPDDQMNRVLVVVDEYETALMTGDREQLESLTLSILNIGRSSGVLVMIGSQSTMKQHIGSLKDKVQNKFLGYLDRQTSVDAREQLLGDYFANLDGEVQGTFFFETSNLRPKQEYVRYKDTDRVLIQTPYLEDFEDYIPKLSHQFSENEEGKIEDEDEDTLKLLF